MSRMTGTFLTRGQPGVTLVVALTLALSACSADGQPTPAVITGAPASAGPTEVPGPPVASVLGGTAGIVPGALGTFTWDGLGSDAPWIVPSGAVPVAADAPLAVMLDPVLVPLRWTARWAPVFAGSAGDPAAVQTGTNAAIEVAAPVSPGTWGLQVDITFAEGRRAAWYWSVTVAP